MASEWLSDHERMVDAMNGCVPCKLCGGKAVITDAGPGSGYYISCENGRKFNKCEGCLIAERRLGGWAYNVRDWWNRLHATTPSAEHPSADAERFYDAVKGYSYPDGREVRARIHATGWDVYDPDKWPCDGQPVGSVEAGEDEGDLAMVAYLCGVKDGQKFATRPSTASEVKDVQAAVELVEWWDTGILRDGLVRKEAAELLAAGKASEYDNVRRAESEVIARIVRRLAALSGQESRS